ncbi:hypothetical protein SAMN03159511_4675 [Pseudomonas sp. NFACC19-2]|jgi:hypothetical protein|uniref:Uncharacterized protein n=2 Tax=Ectopseudomonas toyotomiensis TaxID=554344 RepID=A0ABD7E262_9GAMM|nr:MULTISPECIES: hypothetical protein [Pseudomonadota]MBJ7545712.1 hypothetical protein [Pseudomonas sp. OA3]AQZ32834.1 hypothetical protein BHQ29_05770 [Pseudomonas sp. LPH1]MBG0840876.1 hypothetical protein [Pseudomonas toyotomiensis]MDH1730092.1 hypothetical protein [Pseudomonas chengduensis]MPS96510.1 hypothetical protein [Comamonas sp.]
MNNMNKKLSALLLSGILGAMALPAFAETESDGTSSPGPTMPSAPGDAPMNPADDGDGIPPVQGPNTDGNPGGDRGGSGDGSGTGGSGSGSGSGTGN